MFQGRESFCSEMGLSEPAQLFPSHIPGSLRAIAELHCSKFVRMLFLAAENNAAVCSGAGRAEQETMWWVAGKEKREEVQVRCICAWS